jgi:hypothetical protein
MIFMQIPGRIAGVQSRFLVLCSPKAMSRNFGEVRAMRLTIEIIAVITLLFCLTATSAAFAAGKPARSADGLSCSFSVAKDASPAARCAAIRRQCGGKFFANYCGDKLLSAS